MSALVSLADMPRLTEAELLAEFDAYLDQVEAGAYFLIMREGKPSCVLMPYSEELQLYLDNKPA